MTHFSEEEFFRRRSLTPEQISWVDQAPTGKERKRRIEELKARLAGDIVLDRKNNRVPPPWEAHR